MFEYSEENEVRGEVTVKYDAQDTPINETTREDRNNFLKDAHKIDDDIIPDTEKNQVLHVKLTHRYMKRDVNGMAYTIGGQQAINKM